MNSPGSLFAAVFGVFVQALTLSGFAADDGLAKTRQRLAANEPTTIVCLGDSVTGVYYHTGGRRAYTDMIGVAIQAAYPAAKLTMINAGISGHSTRNGLDRFDADVIAKKPHLVTIMFGLNDMVRVPVADFQKNLKEMIVRARAIDAEVVLCTPNGVIDSSGRPVTKLVEFCEAIRAVGREEKVPVADCYDAYEQLRKRDAATWRLLLSDAIHPNMDGHKIMAFVIAQAIVGKPIAIDLGKVGPPVEPLRHVRSKIATGQKLKIVAMTPYDELLTTALAKAAPGVSIEMVAWPTASQTLGQIADFGKQVRGMKPDLVWVAVPVSAAAQVVPYSEAAIGGYSAILNASLSFGLQEWDVVGASPALLQPSKSDDERLACAFDRRLVHAQDLTLVERAEGETGSTQDLLVAWLKREFSTAVEK